MNNLKTKTRTLSRSTFNIYSFFTSMDGAYAEHRQQRFQYIIHYLPPWMERMLRIVRNDSSTLFIERVMQDIIEKAKNIELVIFDIDGVMTDGSLFFDNNGGEYKAFNSLDGHGLRMLQECGVRVAVITGRKSELVKHRMNDLGITILYQGYRDKVPAFESLLKEVKLDKSQITYVGDDVVDLPVMSQLDFAIAVQNAHPFVKQHAHWITERSGGHGAVREVCEFILEARGLLDDKLHSYLYTQK